MTTNLVPVSTLFIGLHGLIAFILSYIAASERVKTRIWHGEATEDVMSQPNPLDNPNPWVITVERLTQRKLQRSKVDAGALQRKVRAHGNFAEYVPHGLLFIAALELMQAQGWLVWVLGSALTIARIAHAYGVITTYGPSLSRATGFFLTWFVYIIGSIACLYYGYQGLI
ncbi:MULTISPECIES: MAPEG family protein [unclassified Leptolyngbya]|uniref:MAPEG family protein n=1 Tax=unclassified Leptolyngbya TaxID=2650499 RepID=UPI0016879175|nr:MULTISPECIES: MAPEG family protein [unclassified Leptolyngbya]MBD1909097.1 MAPEG family protein [Leptolyngbya sp. FACHB-8]MBD2158554.1 MAPEG family protein [Leptolyngbya sp. FACHB-16]